MDIYYYDAVTGALTGAGTADESPLEPGAFLLPAFATYTKPPKDVEGQARVFRQGKWKYVRPEEPENTSDEPLPPKPPTADDVIAARYARLSAGFAYDFGDDRGLHLFSTSPADMIGWDEVTKTASAMITLGKGDDKISIETETGPVDVTALEWQSVVIAMSSFRQPIWQASFAIMKMDPIPADFATNPEYWPSPPDPSVVEPEATESADT